MKECLHCGWTYHPGLDEVHNCARKPMTTPPKPSDRELLGNKYSRAGGHTITERIRRYNNFIAGFDAATIAERKRCEEMLEIAVGALEDCHSINMRQYGTIDSFQDPAHHTPGTILATLIYEALARISALKEK